MAHDAGVPGVHLDNPSPGSFRLGKQDRKELAPASVKTLRLRPALAATLRPGSSTVPDAELVMLVIAMSSTAITSQVSMRLRAVWW
jgi:hypothetical protein